jgi:hypothetical protein
MSRIKRTTTLLLVCALALAAVPAAAVAQDDPAGDQYVLDVPEGGNGEGADGGSDEKSDSVAAAATEGADDGGLPILLVVLVGTAAIGAGIAIMRRKSTT